MANQTPGHPAPAQPASAQQRGEQQRGEQQRGEKRADPANAQYMIAITPEQYESQLKQAATQVAAKDAGPRPQMEMGGTGTAKASFKDAAGGDVQITGAEWSATGPIVVTADENDPTSAKLVPTGLGPATITVNAATADGSAQTSTDLMVIDKIGAPVAGTIEITVEAPAEGTGRAALPAGQGQGSQIMPVPPVAPPKPEHSRVPPAQTMAQPSPQPQPQDKDKDKDKDKAKPPQP